MHRIGPRLLLLLLLLLNCLRRTWIGTAIGRRLLHVVILASLNRY